MDPAGALAVLNRRILEAYSHRTTDALRAALPLRIALPQLERVLAYNVGKEVEKDALVIRRAGEAMAAGSGVTRELLHTLLDASKEIDRAFLARVGRLPIGIVVPYAEITPIRMRRIERLFGAAYRILEAWQPGRGVRVAVQRSHSRSELEALLLDLLCLYAQETRILSRAVQLPALLTPVRERIALSLYEIMNEAAKRLVRALVNTVYRR